MIKLLEELTNMVAVSGTEHRLSHRVAEILRPSVTDVQVDKFGNVRAFIDKGREKTICFEAHIDEIGLLVKKIDENGFISFIPIGGVDVNILSATEVIVHGKREIRGGITSIPPHLQKDKEKKELKIEDMFIDVGGKTEDIQVGDFVSFVPTPKTLLNNHFCSKSLDNRASIACLIKLAESLKSENTLHNIEILFTVQEEVGCRGAEMIRLDERVCEVITIDVTHGISAVVDDSKGYKLDSVAIGVGPCLSREFADKVKAICENLKIPYEIEVSGGHSGTNAWKFQTKNGGMPAGLISIPIRYMHTPSEVVNIETCENIVKVLRQFIIHNS